jgi:hypothetical protein
MLNIVLETFSGKTLPEVIQSAQTSVNGVVGGAVQAVQATVNEIGEKSVAEVFRSFVALVIAVVKVLFLILTTVVKAVSGKSVSEWAVDANAYIAQEASKLTAKAGAAATNLAEKSLSELAAMMSSFLELVSNLIVEGFNSLGGVVAVSGRQLVESASAPLAGAIARDSIESVSTTLSALTPNL